MLLNTRGIVFRTVKYGETSVIADIFTEAAGLHVFVGGSVRTAKSKMPFNLFQPMTVVDVVSYFREGGNGMHRLKEVRAAEVYQRIPFDLKRGSVALFMAEVCRKTIQESTENEPLFLFLLDVLRYLDTTPHPLANLHLHFLLHLSGYLGFLPEEPDTEASAELYFDLKEGVFSTERPSHGHYADEEATAYLLALLQVPVQHCHEISLPRPLRKTLSQHLLHFYKLHVPGFQDVQSLEVLEMVWSEA